MIQIFIIILILIYFRVITYFIQFNELKKSNKSDRSKLQKKAIAYFGNNTNISPNQQIKQIQQISGKVIFIEDLVNDLVKIDIDLSGLKPNHLHGFHIHEAGDLSDKCESMCAHFNPFNKNHGGPNSNERHVGDLGNIIADKNGKAKYSFNDHLIKLRGICNIIGRGLIIHADTDDLGLGNNKASLITGNAGKRIACAVIGYSKDNFINEVK
jgi:Cu-Zn family superoxide dismutase